jgi:hypothetical protein
MHSSPLTHLYHRLHAGMAKHGTDMLWEEGGPLQVGLAQL